MTVRRRATSGQLFRAGMDMNLAEGGPEHGARTGQFLALFDLAPLWVKLAAAARIVWWRWSGQ